MTMTALIGLCISDSVLLINRNELSQFHNRCKIWLEKIKGMGIRSNRIFCIFSCTIILHFVYIFQFLKDFTNIGTQYVVYRWEYIYVLLCLETGIRFIYTINAHGHIQQAPLRRIMSVNIEKLENTKRVIRSRNRTTDNTMAKRNRTKGQIT